MIQFYRRQIHTSTGTTHSIHIRNRYWWMANIVSSLFFIVYVSHGNLTTVSDFFSSNSFMKCLGYLDHTQTTWFWLCFRNFWALNSPTMNRESANGTVRVENWTKIDDEFTSANRPSVKYLSNELLPTVLSPIKINRNW